MKLVREYIDFTRGKDIKKALDLGIERRIEEWMEDHNLTNYEILWHTDGRIEIDYYGSIYMNELFIPLPNYINFRRVAALEAARLKLKNKDLKGFPREIFGKSTGFLNLRNNKLKSFIGTPKIIENSFSIGSNPLVSLDGLPEKIGGNLFLYDTPISKSEELKKIWERDIKRYCNLIGKIVWD